MSKEKVRQKIEVSLNYLDVTVGITDSDNTNIDLIKDLLFEALKELEEEK